LNLLPNTGHDNKESTQSNSLPAAKQIVFWDPFPLNITGQVFGFGALVALITLLPAELRISERNNGLLLVPLKQVVEIFKDMFACLSHVQSGYIILYSGLCS
jgi:hypothetical protein